MGQNQHISQLATDLINLPARLAILRTPALSPRAVLAQHQPGASPTYLMESSQLLGKWVSHRHRS